MAASALCFDRGVRRRFRIPQSPERWSRILRQVTKLFLAEADRLNQGQIAVFDDVFLRLMDRADTQALAVLSNDL